MASTSIDLSPAAACADRSAGDDSSVSFQNLAIELLETITPARARPTVAAMEPSPAYGQPARAAKPKKVARGPYGVAPHGHPSLAAIGCQVERPTQAEIRERCLEVQARWSPQERESRSMWPTVRWTLPMATGLNGDGD